MHKNYIKLIAVIMLANAALTAHIYGYRIADFSEVPNSQRPRNIVTNVEIDMLGTKLASATPIKR